MKKLFFILVAGTALLSCSQKPGYNVKGEVKAPGFSEKTVVYLSDIDPNNPRTTLKVDSTTLASNKFEFKRDFGIIDSIGGFKIIEIVDGDKKMTGKLYTEQGNIKVEVDSTGILSTGTPLNDAQSSFFKMNKTFGEQMNPLVKKYRDLRQAGVDGIEIEQLEMTIDSIQTQQIAQIKDFVKSNISNAVGQEILTYLTPNLETQEAEELIALVPEAALKSNPRLQRIAEQIAIAKSTAVGSKYIDLTANTPSGSQISISDYVGKNKLVLIDFWASWCGPCRITMPALIKLYKKYHKKGFEVVGVSIDENKEAWEKGIQDLGLLWPQMSDLKGSQTELGAKYAVTSIPYTVLLDQEGTIIAIRPDEAKLAEILSTTLK